MSRCAPSRRRLGRRGAVVVEFGLAAAALFLVVLGILEYGRYFFSVQSVSFLVGEVAQEAILSPVAGCSNPAARHTGKVPVLKPERLSLQLCVAAPGGASNLSRLTVTASYDFDFAVPFLPRPPARISEDVVMEFMRAGS